MSHANQDITHFVILGHPRSGSTMISSALSSHQHIQMYGEVFNDEEDVRKEFFAGDHRWYDATVKRIRTYRKARFYRSNDCGATFLKQAVFYRRWEGRPLAIGIKLFYEQARSRAGCSSWSYLRSRTDLHVIHLLRADLVRSWLSLCIAKETGVWSVFRNQTPEQNVKPFVGDINACLEFIERVLRRRSEVRSKFGEHPYMKIWYEWELCNAFEHTSADIQRFLRVPSQQIRPMTKIQRTVPISDVLVNYQEVRAAVRELLEWLPPCNDIEQYFRALETCQDQSRNNV